MGMEWSSASEGGGENEYETEVIVNVYDLTPINNYISFFGFGIFHSGIQVHGMEYGFGAHEYPTSGVFEVEPKCCPGFVYRCSVSLGRINMPPSAFRQFLEALASEYHGDTYHLISKNCNHFTHDIAFRLTGKCIPGWVNRLAKLGAFCNCLLPESLQETTVKHLPEYHSHAEEDASRSPSTSSHHELTESDDSDRDNKHLLPPLSGPEVAFIKEVSNSEMELFVAVQGQPNSLF